MIKLRTEDDVKELITDYEYEDVIVFSNPDYASAFIGISEDNRAIYDYNMIEFLMREYNITDMEAIEFIDFNTIRALPYIGEGAPIIMHNLVSEWSHNFQITIDK